ncbi:ABC transporter ATP-binding protein [Oceanivirga salmonicida]|uniref:ABC transporter ATP-binding protein n=1 Tax=Oceanivirga salmonicida TaxID=1769291 RepID=UPI0008358C1A|nr:ABC transporter ATP-binding protein [Oceanivirga salmonicida]
MKYFEFKNVSFKYNDTYILENFSFSLDKGEILLIKGKSGIGKSTILRLISGLEILESGNIYLKNIDITNTSPEKRNIGYLFQNFALFPHLSVINNIKYALRENTAEYWLNLVDMNKYANNYPNELSGGEKQRVALARALANSPKLLLLDEPFSSLDEELKNTLRIDMKNILKSLNITTIIVSHDSNDSIIADKIIEIK